jgi:hypothetical protein
MKECYVKEHLNTVIAIAQNVIDCTILDRIMDPFNAIFIKISVLHQFYLVSQM